jgi:hypothetical protein
LCRKRKTQTTMLTSLSGTTITRCSEPPFTCA